MEHFGILPDGEEVQLVRLTGGGLTASFLTWGAVLQDLRLAGHSPPLVLGLERLEDYLAHSPYFGATAGRCANRIGGARFELDGNAHDLEANFLGRHQLHGGSAGLGKTNWRIEDATESCVVMAAELADGHMGYPGRLRVMATFSLPGDGVLGIRYDARSDAATLCNLAHHSYFNLSGDADLSGHRLTVSADRVTEVDDELIPTGRCPDVEGGDYDFRAGRSLGDWPAGLLLDHNFCLSEARQAIRTVGRLEAGPVSMEIRTTEPGLQVYDGAKLAVPVAGLEGRRYGARAGLALEPQLWPDAIHNAGFPSAVLRPDQTYRQHSQFVFAGQAG